MTAYLNNQEFSDDGNNQSVIETWIVQDPIALPTQDSQLPARGSVHALDPRCKADRLSARPADGTLGRSWIATVAYSNNGRFSGPPTNDDNNLAFRTIQDTFANITLEIPLFVRQYVYPKTGDTFTGPVQPTLNWLPSTLKREAYVENVQVVLHRETYTADDRRAIQAQQNKFHYLASNVAQTSRELFKFVGCEVTQISANLWRYVYSWIGSERFDAVATDSSIGIADGSGITVSTPLEVLIPPYRYAFGSYVVIPGTSLTRPKVKVVYPYNTDTSGNPQGTNADITGYLGASQLPGNPV